MPDSVALSVQLSGAAEALAQLTQLDAITKSLKANRNINLTVNSRSLNTAAQRAEQLQTNLQGAGNAARQIGTTGTQNINNAGQALGRASRNAESFRLGMGSVILNMAKFRLASAAINLVASGFKEAFAEMKNVDTELANIRKVTGFTNAQIEKLTKNAYSLASQYGRSASEVLEASTVFARAGYTDQIDQLSELSLLLQNVGDLQADEASKFVIATDKAYKLGGSYEKLMTVIDGLDNITNKNATDMQKMTEGMTVAGSVFAESGESVEMFAALLGTATANTQRSGSEVARGLRTILMNLRQIRGETEDGELIDGESIAAAAKALKDFAGISTMENGQLRKASDVLEELAGKWETLSETQQAAIAEAVGGKRQANILMSIMGDWQSVEKMMGEYEDAAGTAAKENAAYMDSWQAKVEQVKASWTELVASIVDTDLIKGALDGVIGFLDFVQGKWAAYLFDLFANGDKYLQELSDAAVAHARYVAEEFEKDYGENGRYEYLTRNIRTLSAEEKAELAILEARRDVREEELAAAEKLLALNDEGKDVFFGDAKDKVTDILQFGVGGSAAAQFSTSLRDINQEFRNTQDIATYREQIGQLVDEYHDAYIGILENEKAGNATAPQLKNLKNAYELLSESVLSNNNDIESYGLTVAASALAMGYSLEDAENIANQAMDDIAKSMDAVPDEKTITVTVAGYDEAVQKLSSLNAMSGGTVFTAGLGRAAGAIGRALKRFALGTDYAPGGPALVNERGPEMISANGLAFIAGGGKPSIVNLPRGATVLTAEDTKRLTSGGFPGVIRAYAGGTYSHLNLTGDGDTGNPEGLTIMNLPRGGKVILSDPTDRTLNGGGLTGNIPYYPSANYKLLKPGVTGAQEKKTEEPGGGGGPGTGSGTEKSKEEIFKELEDELSAKLKNLDMQAELAENEQDYLKAMQVYGQAQEEIAKLLEQYRAAGYAEDSDEILRLANLGYDYAAKQLGGYDKLQQNLIDALNALTKATEDANELEERKEAVAKAREALANAEKQRTVRIFNPVTGQWEWVANAGDVARAQENLKTAEKALQKEELSQAVNAIKNADASSLGSMTLSPAILDALFSGTPEQQTAFLNALGAATGGANWLTSSAAQTAWNQGSSIGTQYNLNGITLSPEQANGMTIMQLITMLQGLKIM